MWHLLVPNLAKTWSLWRLLCLLWYFRNTQDILHPGWSNFRNKTMNGGKTVEKMGFALLNWVWLDTFFHLHSTFVSHSGEQDVSPGWLGSDPDPAGHLCCGHLDHRLHVQAFRQLEIRSILWHFWWCWESTAYEAKSKKWIHGGLVEHYPYWMTWNYSFVPLPGQSMKWLPS